MSYITLLTKVGQALIATAHATGTPVQLTHLAVGDSGGAQVVPSENQTELIHEVWRGSLNTLFEDPANPNWIMAEAVIPEAVGGWTIREVGLFDTNGLLYAVGSLPDSYKPQLVEGSAKTFYIRMRIEIGNASSVTLLIDPSVVLATKEYVAIEVGKVRTDLDMLTAITEDHVGDHGNPHQVTAAQVGAEPLGAVAAHDGDDEAHPDIRAAIAGIVIPEATTVDNAYVGAGGMTPEITDGAALAQVEDTAADGVKLTRNIMSYQGSTKDTHAYFSVQAPDNWDGGTIRAKVHWKGAAGCSPGDNVRYYLASSSVGDGDTIAQALGAVVTVDDTVETDATRFRTSAASAAMTPSGTPAAGERLYFRLSRDYDYGAQPMSAAAEVLGVTLQFGITGNLAAWA